MTASDQTLESLLQRYARAASLHAKATDQGDHITVNKAYVDIRDCYLELLEQGPEAQRALLSLAATPDLGVRLWVGYHALVFAPDDGERILEALEALGSGFLSFDAAMTLKEWRRGTLKMPGQ